MTMEKKILILGGSPCSGKSTLAEMIAANQGAYYFKVDDFLSEFIDRAAKEGKETCAHYQGLSPEELWMKDPVLHCQDEFKIYEEIAPYVFEKLNHVEADFIVTEGAAYTPQVMKQMGFMHYVTIIPTPEFQIEHYRQREWVPYVLAGCSDPKAAFDNWMQRDILFAQQVKKECAEDGIACFENDGSMTILELYDQVISVLM